MSLPLRLDSEDDFGYPLRAHIFRSRTRQGSITRNLWMIQPLSTLPRNASDGAHPEGSEPAFPRRPYQRPRILQRERLEAMASDCAIPNGKSDSSCILGFS